MMSNYREVAKKLFKSCSDHEKYVICVCEISFQGMLGKDSFNMYLGILKKYLTEQEKEIYLAGDLKVQKIQAEAEKQEREYLSKLLDEILELGGNNGTVHGNQ